MSRWDHVESVLWHLLTKAAFLALYWQWWTEGHAPSGWAFVVVIGTTLAGLCYRLGVLEHRLRALEGR
jgi:hypothetical protein